MLLASGGKLKMSATKKNRHRSIPTGFSNDFNVKIV